MADELMAGGMTDMSTLEQMTLPKSGCGLEQVHKGLKKQGGSCDMMFRDDIMTTDDEIIAIFSKEINIKIKKMKGCCIT